MAVIAKRGAAGLLERRHVMLPRPMIEALERVQGQTGVYGKSLPLAQVIREVIQDGLLYGRYKKL